MYLDFCEWDSLSYTVFRLNTKLWLNLDCQYLNRWHKKLVVSFTKSYYKIYIMHWAVSTSAAFYQLTITLRPASHSYNILTERSQLPVHMYKTLKALKNSPTYWYSSLGHFQRPQVHWAQKLGNWTMRDCHFLHWPTHNVRVGLERRCTDPAT